MIKAILFDADGVLVHQERFSDAIVRDYGISLKTTHPFFTGPFQECLVGRADLKEVISQYLTNWGWTQGVDALLKYWFERDNNFNFELIKYIQGLRSKKIKCFLATNQEKYRFAYLIDRINFSKTLDNVYCSANLGYKKPKQNFFLKIFNDLENIKKEEVLFWDDDIVDIQRAKDFGIHAELYTSFENFKEKMKQYIV